MPDLKERTSTTSAEAKAGPAVDLKFEVVVIPVSDVERTKQFYTKLGWRLDADSPASDDYRVIQFTPPGSPALGHLRQERHRRGARLRQGTLPDRLRYRGRPKRACSPAASTSARPSTTKATCTPGRTSRICSGAAASAVVDPERGSYRSYASFNDPDGNGWLLQEVTARLPGRVAADSTTFASPADLAAALRRAAIAHGEHEKRNGGQHDVNWPDWYADYIVKEQAGEPLPV